MLQTNTDSSPMMNVSLSKSEHFDIFKCISLFNKEKLTLRSGYMRHDSSLSGLKLTFKSVTAGRNISDLAPNRRQHSHRLFLDLVHKAGFFKQIVMSWNRK